MKFALFYHSLCSDWNNGHAHFLRGYARELVALGHSVHIYEPCDGWSRAQLIAERGTDAVWGYREHYPQLCGRSYDLRTLELSAELVDTDVAIVHEWNDPRLIAAVGRWAKRSGRTALFHDSHHRSVSAPAQLAALELGAYSGVLAYGRSVAAQYLRHAWAARVWVWHEAADTRHFRPIAAEKRGDLIWIGNWGDEERSAELREFLIEPARALALNAAIHGVGYPPDALESLRDAGIRYRGWLANYEVPSVFAQYRCTVHVPRRSYVHALPGVPTIRMFEALACGIPLISAPWDDEEELFNAGSDYWIARNGRMMRDQLHSLLSEPDRACELARAGLRTIQARHTCAHRVAELLDIIEDVQSTARAPHGRCARGALG